MRSKLSGIVSLLVVGLLSFARAATPARPEAIVVVAADIHSAYERAAHFVAHVDRLKKENPNVPLAILVNGDALEYGNAVARRSGGVVDFEMFRKLAERAPTIVNLGNHEADFRSLPDAVMRLSAAGVTVVSANARDRETDAPLAPASARLNLGRHEALVVGFLTDRLDTFRAAVRPTLDLRDPVAWARERLPELLRGEPLPIVLSHAGLKADRQILPLVPPGTLYAGAHDHLQFVHREGRTVYFQSGSWLELFSIARLERAGNAWQWVVEPVRIESSDPAEAGLAALIDQTAALHITAEEAASVGRAPRALAPSEAARFAVEAARGAARADAAVIGGTTFGAGLPAGEVSRAAFDAFVRFDGTLWVAEVTGARLREILARANHGPRTPFAARTGENLVMVLPLELHPEKTYRLATTDWAARHAKDYFGENPPAFAEQPELTLKAAVIAALDR